jgi:hypothetical protein
MLDAAEAAQVQGGGFVAQFQAALLAAPELLSFVEAVSLARACAREVENASPDFKKGVQAVADTMLKAADKAMTTMCETTHIEVAGTGGPMPGELLPCPWCGETPELELRTYDTASSRTYGISCCVEMETQTTDQLQAIIMWNDRAAPAKASATSAIPVTPATQPNPGQE